MANRPGEEDQEKTRWTYVEKISTLAVGTVFTGMFGALLGSWDSMRDFNIQMADLDDRMTTIEERLDEKRPSGRTRDQQMQFNTDRQEALVELIKRIQQDDKELEDQVKANHEGYHNHLQAAAQTFSNIKERCARVQAELDTRR